MFTGRSNELEQLLGFARDASAGHACVVIVEGEAGLGKTALVREFRDRVAGFTKVTAACDPLATDESGWMLRQLVGGTPADGAFAAGLDLLEWLGERQADGPVLLIVEDLHWCDPLSIGALVTALRRLDTDRLMAVITVRPGEIDAHTPGTACSTTPSGPSACASVRSPRRT